MNDSETFDINELMRPHRICLCKGVTESDIKKAINEQGARDFEAVQAITHCSTGCGTCEQRVRHLIDEIIR